MLRPNVLPQVIVLFCFVRTIFTFQEDNVLLGHVLIDIVIDQKMFKFRLVKTLFTFEPHHIFQYCVFVQPVPSQRPFVFGSERALDARQKLRLFHSFVNAAGVIGVFQKHQLRPRLEMTVPAVVALTVGFNRNVRLVVSCVEVLVKIHQQLRSEIALTTFIVFEYRFGANKSFQQRWNYRVDLSDVIFQFEYRLRYEMTVTAVIQTAH